MDWSDLVDLTEDYLKGAEIDGVAEVIRLHIRLGNENESMRKSAEISIRSILKGRDGSPFKSGIRSDKPVKVRITVDEIGREVYAASFNFYNAVPNGILLKHGKSGGGRYEDAEEYAEAETKRIKTALHKKYKKGTWNGTRESLL